MAYYLTIKENKDHKLLDITGLSEFEKKSKFKGASYSLEEINLFTAHFESELSLKRRLYNAGVITLDDIPKDIAIRIKLNGKLEKVQYGLVYMHMYKFLNVDFLRYKLLSLQEDTVFLNKLLDYYRNSHKQEGMRQINALLHGYDAGELNMYNALNLFFNDTVLSIDYSTGVVEVKYKALHDLAMFIYNYLYKKDKCKIVLESEKIGRIKELNGLKEALTPKETCVKRRVREKIREEIEGQQSFFD